MIELKDLLKIYRTEEIETKAINELSLRIEAGEFISIMGPSGCGKSTLLNILGMIDQADQGSYHFMGEEITSYSERQRSKIRKENLGFVFQSFNLIDELSVYENVELPMIYVKTPATERKRRVTELLEQMNIMHRAKHFPQQLSGGQQQRVAVARAVANHPKLILADEPTGNLDSSNGDEVMKLLADLHHKGTTIVMVTHSKHAAQFSERVVHLLDGKIVTENRLQ